MNLLIKKIIVLLIIIYPFVSQASNSKIIPEELLEISCENSGCSSKISSDIKRIYKGKIYCGDKFEIGPRIQIIIQNILSSHYRNYHFNIREFCSNGVIPVRKNVTKEVSSVLEHSDKESDNTKASIQYNDGRVTAFTLAWETWLFYSLMGFVFSLISWKYNPVISLIYVIGGVILVFTKYSDPSFFGVSESIWKNDEYWKDVRQYLVYGQLVLSGLVMFIEFLLIESSKKVPAE